MIAVLLDEHLPEGMMHKLRAALVEAVVIRVGMRDAPAIGTKDADLLRWCSREGFVLITQDKRTMPGHLQSVVNENRVVPGVITLTSQAIRAETVNDVALLLLASEPYELANIVRHVPL